MLFETWTETVRHLMGTGTLGENRIYWGVVWIRLECKWWGLKGAGVDIKAAWQLI